MMTYNIMALEHKWSLLITTTIWTITGISAYLLRKEQYGNISFGISLLGFFCGFFILVILCVKKNTTPNDSNKYILIDI